MTIPLVVMLGILAFGLVKWGSAKVSAVIVGILFGLALASTQVGPPILSGLQAMMAALFTGINSAIQ